MPSGTDNARELEILQIQSIMSQEAGRNFMWRLLRQSGVMFDNFDADPTVNAMLSGKRSIGIWLQQELQEAAPGSYLTMMKEGFDDGR